MLDINELLTKSKFDKQRKPLVHGSNQREDSTRALGCSFEWWPFNLISHQSTKINTTNHRSDTGV